MGGGVEFVQEALVPSVDAVVEEGLGGGKEAGYALGFRWEREGEEFLEVLWGMVIK